MDRTELIAEPGRQEAIVARVFDAPREQVFAAYTDPEFVRQWWAPREYATVIEQSEVRPGGRWRYLNRDAAGTVFAFHGVYHQVQPPERLVLTFEYDGEPGHVSLETVTFEDRGGRTKVTDQTVFQSVEDRDRMLKAGMEQAAPLVMDQLAELLLKTPVAAWK
jgi:uncharacterized protein YndB with AHSA1/START domain